MSTWISDPARPRRRRGRPLRAAGLTLAALALSGCVLEGRLPALSLPFRAANAPLEPAPGIRVARGAVAIAGPAGYCVDPVATREANRGAFVLLGTCAALTGSGPAPARRAALTAAVSPPGEGPGVADSLDLLPAFFGSETGRALIARSGNPEAVRLISSHARDGVLYLRLRDESPFEGAEVLPDYWRAVMDSGRHVVSLSAIPLASRPLGPDATLTLLEEFVARTRAENAGPTLPERALRPPPPRPASA